MNDSMIKKIILLFLLLLQGVLGISQGAELSPLSKISLLTVGTGEDLAAKFGHSAIRFQDPTLGIDVVYGYGTYDFEDPNFYLNFVRGKLAYTISRMPFTNFELGYQIEERWIKEQELNLNLERRKEILFFLENNLLPENRKYQYDFLFDNCATKIPEVFEKTLGPALQFDYSYLKNQYTFRQLIHQNLEVNSWSNFGIDLALGSVIDRKATPYEHLFLPLYVYEQMKHTTLNGKPIVKNESVLLDISPKENSSLFLLTPIFWLSVIMLLVLFITYKDFTKKTRTPWVDVFLFLATGLAGILILFLWLFTDHNATKMNFNFLWAFAPNVVVGFYLIKKQLPKWIGKYVIALLVLLIITCVLWILQIQIFSILLVFILIALAVRYSYLFWYFKHSQNPSIV